jgi:hypothetical protein
MTVIFGDVYYVLIKKTNKRHAVNSIKQNEGYLLVEENAKKSDAL